MKRQLFALGLLALALNACGDGKKKRGPVGPYGNSNITGPNGEVVLPGEDSYDEGFDCSNQSVSQNDDCGGQGPLLERSFRVVMKRSKRSNDFFGQGYVDSQNSNIEQCLRSLRISGESFDLAFQNMDLLSNGLGMGARCQL